MAWELPTRLPPQEHGTPHATPQEHSTPHAPRTTGPVADAPPSDPWPALPDDESLWVPLVSAFTDLDHIRSLDAEQRGA